MWILPSRGRPQNIERLVAAYNQTGATTHIMLWLDDDDPMLSNYQSYPSIPTRWTIVIGNRQSLSGIYNQIFNVSFQV